MREPLLKEEIVTNSRDTISNLGTYQLEDERVLTYHNQTL